MDESVVLELAQEALLICIQIGAPALVVGLVVGVAIALVQALTQIQEITLVFVPKILAIFLTLMVFLPWMMNVLVIFMEELADRIIGMS
ncbi:MAG: flagellar biosynthesis protein FliQ [Alphaproteobacteria bacterium]|nr:flagellar biosynthesis protein FliQ [Alphaproteobacteria bacterium]